MNMTHVTTSDITEGFVRVGLERGMKVLVHSSLSSFGYVDGGAEAVIKAILDVIGSEGTLVVPTLTGNESLSVSNPPTFDPLKTNGWTGIIPETLRSWPGAVRSVHPTHSVVAVGKDATELTEGHINSITPCDELSPYGKLAELNDSYILLIGVGHESNTTFHHVEELAGLDYHIQQGLVRAELLINDAVIYRHYFLHQYGVPRNFSVVEPLFIEHGIQNSTKIGASTVRLVKTQEMAQIVLRCVRGDSTILCKYWSQ